MKIKIISGLAAGLIVIALPMSANSQTQEQKDTVGHYSSLYNAGVEMCPHLFSAGLADRCKNSVAACLASSDPRQVTDFAEQTARWKALGTCVQNAVDPVVTEQMTIISKLTKDHCYGGSLLWDEAGKKCYFEPK